MNNKSGRVFGASLKPAWSVEQINEFLIKTKGDIIVFVINHDKDEVEAHTHIYLEYSTPRKISTVANLLEVEGNFIEVIRNKKGYLRYLTHMDEIDKHEYNDSEVLTNSEIGYTTLIMGNSLSDKEIADYIMQGRGFELLGVVSSSKLRTIQGFLHFDNSNAQQEVSRQLKAENDVIKSQNNAILENLTLIEEIACRHVNAEGLDYDDMVWAMMAIANEIGKTKAIVSSIKRRRLCRENS